MFLNTTQFPIPVTQATRRTRRCVPMLRDKRSYSAKPWKCIVPLSLFLSHTHTLSLSLSPSLCVSLSLSLSPSLSSLSLSNIPHVSTVYPRRVGKRALWRQTRAQTQLCSVLGLSTPLQHCLSVLGLSTQMRRRTGMLVCAQRFGATLTELCKTTLHS